MKNQWTFTFLWTDCFLCTRSERVCTDVINNDRGRLQPDISHLIETGTRPYDFIIIKEERHVLLRLINTRQSNGTNWTQFFTDYGWLYKETSYKFCTLVCNMLICVPVGKAFYNSDFTWYVNRKNGNFSRRINRLDLTFVLIIFS